MSATATRSSSNVAQVAIRETLINKKIDEDSEEEHEVVVILNSKKKRMGSKKSLRKRTIGSSHDTMNSAKTRDNGSSQEEKKANLDQS
jgi:hypothetical protein